MKRSHKLTKHQIIELVDRYKTNKYTQKKLSDMYGISKSAVSKLLQRRNIYVDLSIANRKYKANHNYFDIINSEHKAYWLGFLYADGCNYAKLSAIKLSLQDIDIEILKKFKKDLQSNRPISTTNIKKKYPNRQNLACVSINSPTMSKRLSELGCVPNKTFLLSFPTETQVPSKLIRHFIRGYFDGDGCLTFGHYSKFKTLVGQVNVVSTLDFCESLQRILIRELNIKGCISHDKRLTNKPTRSLHIKGNLQCIKLLQWMYEDSTIFLERKHNKYLAYYELFKNRRTHK